MTPAEADERLWEWSRWSRVIVVDLDYPHACEFGLLIKPDPSPSREPVDVDRAERTEMAVLRTYGRRRFLVKLHYLGRADTEAKAKRARMCREEYLKAILGVQRVIAEILDPARNSACN